jgi:two-component system CheB/CheR fusion protein
MFPETVFTSLRSAVVVLDRDLRVQVWNAGALEMWGLRSEEAHAVSFFALDIGLPFGELHQPIRDVLSRSNGHRELTIGATNRRGRQIRCHVSVAPLLGNDRKVTGVILVMENERVDASVN